MQNKKEIIIVGGIIGFIAVALVYYGNPVNMGFCIACFLRDISGAIGLHRATVVQYIRPEVIGLIIGSLFVAVKNKEFVAKAGSSPLTRFILGIIVMIGALMFLGCPLRMVLRLGGGDLNALIGIAGFIAGILVGIYFLNKGFNLKRNYRQTKVEGLAMPAISVLFLVLLVIAPTFIFFSVKGPGALHAPILLSLIAGLVVGVLAQKTRMCMVGGIRDFILFKDNSLLLGFIAIIVFSLVGNIVTGAFNVGISNQPIAHSDALWNFLGMFIVGWGSIMLGGCPLRQLVLAGEGNSDSAVTIMGLLVGSAIAHNFGLAASPKGPTSAGQIAIVICVIVLTIISYFNSELLTRKE